MPKTISRYYSVSRSHHFAATEKRKNRLFFIAVMAIIFSGLFGALFFLAPVAFGNYAKLVIVTDALAMAYCLALFIRRRD